MTPNLSSLLLFAAVTAPMLAFLPAGWATVLGILLPPRLPH